MFKQSAWFVQQVLKGYGGPPLKPGVGEISYYRGMVVVELLPAKARMVPSLLQKHGSLWQPPAFWSGQGGGAHARRF